MCCRYQSDVHVPGVQAQVQCTGALVHRCTGTVYQQVILQVQCELCSVQGINTMYSVQCNVHTPKSRGLEAGGGRQGIQLAPVLTYLANHLCHHLSYSW